jgi:GTPase SAR1 family protein
VVAVLGAPGVGKTTVIKRATKAWGLSSSIVFVTHDGFTGEIVLKHPKTYAHPCFTFVTTVSSYRSQVQPGGKLKYASTVDFLEMDLGALRFSSSEEIWPKELPFVHGAILCYDATQRATLRDVPEALREYG